MITFEVLGFNTSRFSPSLPSLPFAGVVEVADAPDSTWELQRQSPGKKSFNKEVLTHFVWVKCRQRKWNKVRLAGAPTAAKQYLVVSLQLLKGVQTNQRAKKDYCMMKIWKQTNITDVRCVILMVRLVMPALTCPVRHHQKGPGCPSCCLDPGPPGCHWSSRTWVPGPAGEDTSAGPTEGKDCCYFCYY